MHAPWAPMKIGMSFRQLRMAWANEPGATVVRLHGDLDAHAATEAAALHVVADDAPHLVVDLEAVWFVDVPGLDLLEDLARRPTVTVRNPSAPILRILQRTEGVTDEWAALRALM